MQSSTTIFLIDDDGIQLKIGAKMIERALPGGCITPFNDGRSALEFLATNRQCAAMLPDVIFLDLNMPEMSGWEFLEIFERIKQTFAKQIRVYILTSSENELDIARSRDHGSVRDYLVKPITGDAIRLILE